MRHSPTRKKWCLSQISRIVWDLQFRCRIYEIPHLVSVLSHISLVHAFSTYLFTTNDNSIPSSTTVEWLIWYRICLHHFKPHVLPKWMVHMGLKSEQIALTFSTALPLYRTGILLFSSERFLYI